MDIMSSLMAHHSLDQIALEIFLLLDGKSLHACVWTCPTWRHFILDNTKHLDFSNKYAKVMLDDFFEKGVSLPDPFWLNNLVVGHNQFFQIGDREAIHFSKAAPILSHGMALFNENFICIGHNCEGILRRFRWSELGQPLNEEAPPADKLVQLPTSSYNLKLCFRNLLVWRSSASDNHAILNVSKLNGAATKLELVISLDLREVAAEVPQILDIIGWKRRLKLCQFENMLLITLSPNSLYVSVWHIYLFMIDLDSSTKVWQHLCHKRFDSNSQSIWDYSIQPFLGHKFCGLLLNMEHISNVVMFLSNQSGHIIWESDKLIAAGRYYVACSKSSVVVVPIMHEVDDPQAITHFFQVSNAGKVRGSKLTMETSELQGSGFWSKPSEGVLYADRYLGFCHSGHFYLHDLLSCPPGNTPKMRHFNLPGKSLGSSYKNFTGNVWLCHVQRKQDGSTSCNNLERPSGEACLLRFPKQPELQKMWHCEEVKVIKEIM